jgi:hypothetical protein
MPSPLTSRKGLPTRASGTTDEARCTLARAGFDPGSVRTQKVTVVWRLQTVELLFEAELHAGVRASAVLRAQPPEQLAAIRAAVLDGVQRHADSDEFALPIVCVRDLGATGEEHA